MMGWGRGGGGGKEEEEGGWEGRRKGGGAMVKSHVLVNGTLSYWQCLLSYTTVCI